tara:strand:- start:489 stop:827 length:339 start_codon:yes stop_codon:yes gene_type:complete
MQLKNIKSLERKNDIISIYSYEVTNSSLTTHYDAILDQDIKQRNEIGHFIALVDYGMGGQWFTHATIDKTGNINIIKQHNTYPLFNSFTELEAQSITEMEKEKALISALIGE